MKILINNKKLGKWIVAAYLLVLFTVMLIWSYKTPYMNDDLYFANAKWNSLIKLGIDDYLRSNGRIFGQTFTRIIVSKGILFSSVCTAFLFTILIILLLLLTKSIELHRIYPIRIVAVTVSVFYFVPAFGSVFLWRAGVGNYLATAVVELGYLLLFINSYRAKNIKIFAIIVLGFIAGWGNENTSGAVILISILLIIKEHKRVSRAQIAGTISTIIGFAFLLLSPGSQIRLRLTMPMYSKLSLGEKAKNGVMIFTDYFANNQIALAFFAIVIAVIVVASMYWQSNATFLDGLIFIVGGFSSALAMIISPAGTNSGRTYLGAFLLLIVGMMLLIPKRFGEDKGVKCVYISTVTIIAMLCFFSVSNGIHQSVLFNNQLRNRYTFIKNHPSSVIKVKPLSYEENNYSISVVYSELTPSMDSQKFPNNCYAQYFHKNVILK